MSGLDMLGQAAQEVAGESNHRSMHRKVCVLPLYLTSALSPPHPGAASPPADGSRARPLQPYDDNEYHDFVLNLGQEDDLHAMAAAMGHGGVGSTVGSNEDENEFSGEEQDAPLEEAEDHSGTRFFDRPANHLTSPAPLTSLSRTQQHTAPPQYDRGGFGRPWTSSSPSRRRPSCPHPPPPLILVDRQEQAPAAVRAMYQDMARNPSTYAQPLKPTSKPPPLTLESIGLPPDPSVVPVKKEEVPFIVLVYQVKGTSYRLTIVFFLNFPHHPPYRPRRSPPPPPPCRPAPSF